MIGQAYQRLHHMCVAQIPGGDFSPKHVAVIFLCVADHERVLLRAEIRVGRDLAIALQIFHRLATKCNELFDDCILTSRRHSKSGRVSVGLDLLTELFETTLMMPRTHRCFRINLVQVGKHSFD
jgi:hypothetical protein